MSTQLKLVKKRWRGNLILNNELTAETAAEAVRCGVAQVVSFGRYFIGNPDLVDRLRWRLPLASYDTSRLYTPGPQYYTIYSVKYCTGTK